LTFRAEALPAHSLVESNVNTEVVPSASVNPVPNTDTSISQMKLSKWLAGSLLV
jgi:hypothetical protein